MNLVIVADVWHTMPFVALVLQAALATLPADLEEAAAVDGANAWQRFWQIRVPLLRPAILVALIVRTVDAFRVFDIVYIITAADRRIKTLTITYLTYLNSFSFGKQGTGAALSFLISIVTIVMALVYIRILYRPEETAVCASRRVPAKAAPVPAHPAGILLHFLSDPVAVQRQSFHAGGAVHGAAALDPAASDLPELHGHLLSRARRPRPCRAPSRWRC